MYRGYIVDIVTRHNESGLWTASFTVSEEDSGEAVMGIGLPSKQDSHEKAVETSASLARQRIDKAIEDTRKTSGL